MFNKLIKWNCFSSSKLLKSLARNLLEKFYCCEVHCDNMAKSVLFAHHARGCTIVAAKLGENVVIFQNVTIGSNMKYNKLTEQWENVGSPIIDKNVVIADGSKVLGPIIIGANTVIAAGAIITINIPENSVAFGVNKFRPKDPNYDLVFNRNMIDPQIIVSTDRQRVSEFNIKRK